MPSDTHTDEELGHKPFDCVLWGEVPVPCADCLRLNREANEQHKTSLDGIIRQRERAAQLALIERLRKHGHGGGNWRRLLDEEAKKLEE